MLHYFTPISLNDSHRLIATPRNRARKRLMDTNNLTYHKLKLRMAEEVRAKAESAQTYANLTSALNALMGVNCYSENNLVGSTLRSSYFKNRAAHISILSTQGKSPSYIANRKTYLGRWHRLVLKIDNEQATAAGASPPLAAALKEMLSSCTSLTEVASQAGISLASLRRWLSGTKPNESARPSISRLERFFGLVPGELLAISGLNTKGGGVITTGDAPRILYRQLLRKNAVDTYALKTVEIPLREEWAALVLYKTARTTFSKARQKNGRWSTTTEKVKLRSENNWYAFVDELYVATAEIRWSYVAQYLGWLQLSHERGGAGMSLADVQSLVHLTDGELLGKYTDWRIDRAEQKVNGGIISFLQFVKSLCHPKTGYLGNTPHFYKRMSVSESIWRDRCRTTFEFSKDTISMLLEQCEPTRDSFEPLKAILELKNPMDAVADGIQRLNAARPGTGGTAEAIWARDRLLLKLLSSNPLRAKNLKMLKIDAENPERSYLGEDTGHLYRNNEAGWRISIPRKHFKNFAGAAKDRDYDMPIEPSLWADIENYLLHYRPLISSPDNPYLFTSSREVASSGMMYGLNRRVEALTRLYFWRCPGFGPHGFRHIVATAILKLSPNDWQTASLVLHDRPDTVQAHYAHLRSNDGAERQFEILSSSYQRM